MTSIPATCTLVSDAVSTSDIRMVVRAAIGLVPETIFVGSGALGVVLAEECRPECDAAVHPIPVAKSMLVLCGSRHPASHRQIEFLSREAGALIVRTEPGESLDTGLRQAMAGLDAGRPVAVKCNPGSVGGPPDAVSAWLAEFARRLFAVRSPDVLYLTGGETAACVCRRLRGRILEVVRELEPGVVLSRLVRGDGADVGVISKPGGYGSADIMVRNFRENKAIA